MLKEIAMKWFTLKCKILSSKLMINAFASDKEKDLIKFLEKRLAYENWSSHDDDLFTSGKTDKAVTWWLYHNSSYDTPDGAGVKLCYMVSDIRVSMELYASAENVTIREYIASTEAPNIASFDSKGILRYYIGNRHLLNTKKRRHELNIRRVEDASVAQGINDERLNSIIDRVKNSS